MKFERQFTKKGQDAYAGLEFKTTTSEIKNPDGTIVFSAPNIEVPANYSQVAADIIAQKYFRKAGVPVFVKKIKEDNIPSWLYRSEPDQEKLSELPEDKRFKGEESAKQVFDRLAGTWTYWGWKGNYFTTEEDAKIYFDEMRFMLAAQMCAPNSPQWFNTEIADNGLNNQSCYRCSNPEQGHVVVVRTERLKYSTDIGVLQRKAKLDAHEAKAHVPDLPEAELGLLSHRYRSPFFKMLSCPESRNSDVAMAAVWLDIPPSQCRCGLRLEPHYSMRKSRRVLPCSNG